MPIYISNCLHGNNHLVIMGRHTLNQIVPTPGSSSDIALFVPRICKVNDENTLKIFHWL